MANDDDFDQEEIQEEQPAPQGNFRRQLEKDKEREKARADAAEVRAAEGDQARRELAFVKAGIDTEKGGGKLLFKSYDGELTKEGIIKAAEEYDIIPTSQKQEVRNELSALEGIQQASNSSSAPLPPDIFSQIKSAKSEEEVLALAGKLGVAISNEAPGEFFDPRG